MADPLDDFLTEAAGPAAPVAASGTGAEQAAATVAGEPAIVPADPQAGQVVYHLLAPRLVDGARLDRVVLRLPGTDDVEPWQAGRTSGRGLIAALCGVDERVLARLALVDAEILAGIADLLVPGFAGRR